MDEEDTRESGERRQESRWGDTFLIRLPFSWDDNRQKIFSCFELTEGANKLKTVTIL